MSQTRVTVKEIAREAGVSIGTVDRVLHGRADVSESTRKTVESIVLRLGYKPNALARNLSLNLTRTFRAFLPLSSQDSGYWAICRRGIEAGMAEFSDYGVELRVDEFDRYDKPAFRRLLAGLAEDPGAGLLVAPVLPDELLRGLGKLPHGYPCVFFDGSVEGTLPFATVGQDARRAGHAAARMMTLLAPAAGTYVAVNAHAEDWHIRQRIEGFRSYFAEASGKGRTRSPGKPGIAVRDCFDIEEPAALEAFMKGLIEREDGMGGILVANSSGHLVGEWLARSGRKKGCAVVTWDLVPANERGLRDGSVDCVVSQRPYAQARVALATLVRHVTGVGADPGRIDIPIELWFRENLPAAGAEERGEL